VKEKIELIPGWWRRRTIKRQSHEARSLSVYLYFFILGSVYTYRARKKYGNPLKNLKKYKIYKRMFQIKVVEFKNIYLLILSIWSWLVSPRLSHIDFLKIKTLIFYYIFIYKTYIFRDFSGFSYFLFTLCARARARACVYVCVFNLSALIFHLHGRAHDVSYLTWSRKYASWDIVSALSITLK